MTVKNLISDKNKNWVPTFRKSPFYFGVVLAIAFYISLHPASSLFGGLFFLIAGWFIPDALNFSISYGIAKKIGGGKLGRRVLVFICVSVLLTVAINLPALVSYIQTHPTAGYQVFRRIDVKARESAVFDLNSNGLAIAIYPYLFTPKVEIGGDEGCGCFYFKENWEETYYWALSNEINNFIGAPTGLRSTNFSLAPAKGVHYALSLEKASGDTYDLQFDVFENNEKTASFWQKGLPSSIVSNEKYAREHGLDRNFFINTTNILLKNTYLSSALSRLIGLSYFPKQEIKQFLDEALIIRDPPVSIPKRTE